MTSCLMVKAPDRLVAVADGRLSLSDTKVSFDTTMKIVGFTPRYRIHVISMGRFSHFNAYTARDWFVGYAGSYALVEEVLNLFRKRISERLVLVWEGGAAVLAYEFDTRWGFDESYHFGAHQYPEITPEIVAWEFKAAAQEKCDEWSRNRRIFPDCEFLLFGQDPKHKYSAFKVTCDRAGWSPGASVRIQADAARDGDLMAIGSRAVASAAFGDADLLAGLEGWRADQSRAGVAAMLADPMWRDMFAGDEPKPAPAPAPPPPVLDWSVEQVAARFCDLLRSTGDASVGGSLTVASGVWFGGVSLKSRT
ncbi:MAG TPA: hypothetical protein VFH92_06930 [Phenylobacterium sp.]|nr:hypothetical protein [Phenylobacterium sp.]